MDLTYNFLKSLYKDIVSMISGMVVKRNDLAKAAETIESIRAFEQYLACVNGSRYFYTFPSYELDILEQYYDPATARRYHLKPFDIPEKDRDLIVKDQANFVLENYVEKNEYYRTLMGLPALNDHRWIYVTGQPDIPELVPIHELTIEQISHLETRGILARLQRDNPDKEYLKYLGVNSIDLIEARLAKPFEILRIGPSANPRAVDMFKEQYYIARRYILATAYNPAEMTTKTLYDPIIGILILTLAVRNTLVPDEEAYLNFEEVLDAILESYDFLQYFKPFPFTYKKRLVLAMDRLLMNKGTDGVLVDVCKIFSKDDLIANRYYLLKYPTKDAEGHVMFTGDPNRDYTMEFVRASILEHDINLKEENRIAYNTVTDNDYLWQLTPEDKEKLLQKDFNLMITKYVDVEAAYETTSLAFEVCCFLNLLLYARDNINKINVPNLYATSGKCSLFTMVNFLLAAMAKRAHFDGNIVYDPESVAQVWRFNYGDIEGKIREIVAKYELRVDVDRMLVEGFPMVLAAPFGNETPNGVINVYMKNKALYDAILIEMHNTNDIGQYIALANCRDTLFTSAMEEQSFIKMDGTHANTYYEMLMDLDPKLAKKLDSIDPDDDDTMNGLLIYILEQLQAIFDGSPLDYLFLNTPTVYGSLIGRYIRTAINVFKAHLIQLRSINIYFNMGDRDPVNVIDSSVQHRSLIFEDSVKVVDTVTVSKVIFLDEYVSVGDKVYTNTD